MGSQPDQGSGGGRRRRRHLGQIALDLGHALELAGDIRFPQLHDAAIPGTRQNGSRYVPLTAPGRGGQRLRRLDGQVRIVNVLILLLLLLFLVIIIIAAVPSCHFPSELVNAHLPSFRRCNVVKSSTHIGSPSHIQHVLLLLLLLLL